MRTMGASPALAILCLLPLALADGGHHHQHHQRRPPAHHHLRHQQRPAPRALSPLRQLLQPHTSIISRLGRGGRRAPRPRPQRPQRRPQRARAARTLPKIAYQKASSIPGYQTFTLHEVIRRREGTEVFEGGRKPDVIRVVAAPKAAVDFSDRIDERTPRVEIPAQEVELTPAL